MAALPIASMPSSDARPFTHRAPIFGLGDVALIVPTRQDAATLLRTLDRIPRPVVARVRALLVHDDASVDGTAELARWWAARHLDVDVAVVVGDAHVGRAANLLAAFAWAAQRGLRLAVTLPGDGGAAPELIATVLRPLVHGAADVVLAPVPRRPGGPPALPVRRLLTSYWNRSTGLRLADWFSSVHGYRLDRLGVDSLAHLAQEAQFEIALVREAAARGLRVAQPVRMPRARLTAPPAFRSTDRPAPPAAS